MNRYGDTGFRGYLGAVYTSLVDAGFATEAERLSREWGGLKRYVPGIDNLRPTSPLVRLVGMDAARVLAEAFGPSHVYFARCAERPGLKATIVQHLDNGLRPREIARQTGVTEEWVRRVRSTIGMQPFTRWGSTANG
ncbi:helix-turn-helix domain-containing protein [Mycobacterium sp. KBS0706]|uniref:helix-turn-helix domain-containing protein n=1 Tax=Mycobacterium sp. KBS0706 TaxID=2578109 RepID=UPI00110F8EE1|nr:helix-turn-helix domain-containing protein [Mycobacterium sp. KBS0706]TSD85608.1 helix-turn-helix domain-containing protein [Mycobacterium sp. KBS0706]